MLIQNFFNIQALVHRLADSIDRSHTHCAYPKRNFSGVELIHPYGVLLKRVFPGKRLLWITATLHKPTHKSLSIRLLAYGVYLRFIKRPTYLFLLCDILKTFSIYRLIVQRSPWG